MCALENTRRASAWGDTSTYQAIFRALSTLYLLSTVHDASAKSRQVQWDSCPPSAVVPRSARSSGPSGADTS